MSELKIVAALVSTVEGKEDVLKALYKITDATRQEEGNISYSFFEDTKNPLKFVLIEEWQSQQAIDFHNNTDHFQAFVKEIEGKTESLDIDIIRKIY